MEDMKFNNKKKTEIKKSVNSIVKNFEIPNLKKKNENNTKTEVGIEKLEHPQKFKKERVSRKRLGQTPSFKKNKKIINNATLIIFIFCFILGISYWGGELIYKANINIKSKIQEIDIQDKIFSAVKDSTSNLINFEIIMTSDKKVKSLILTDTKEVSLKSKGTVTFYNEFSATPQKIIAGSFVSDDDGKAYKIDKTIIIPGYKLDKDKKVIPGKINTPVTAFLAGDIYNGLPEKIYISSFKNTDKYKKIYGLMEEPFKGGASGLVYYLNDENKRFIKEVVESSLKNDLINQVKAELPKGYILYNDASNFSYKIDDDILSISKEAKIDVYGYLSVVILNENSLIKAIMKNYLPAVSNENEIKEIKLSGLNDLSFSFKEKDFVITKDVEKVEFSLDGILDAIWYPDLENLKNKLLGINKNDVSNIFKQDPGIASAIVKIFPPWKNVLPNNILRINMISNLTK